MDRTEVKEIRTFVDRFLDRLGEVERERDAERYRYECLAYELEDLIEKTHGVINSVQDNQCAAWEWVLRAGVLPEMTRYLQEREVQKQKQKKGVR